MKLRVGEHFIIGFRGGGIPHWVRDFETRFGLGGVILFDYDCSTKKYENNIFSPSQLKELCTEISKFKSRPMIFVDQEGGKVRRLKAEKGFAPLPSAKEFAALPRPQRLDVVKRSYHEMRSLGIHFNLAPVIDLDLNPENPDIGKIGRSFSRNPEEVRDNVKILSDVAESFGLGLCLKHYPGLGGAKTNSHLDITDLTESVPESQLNLFYELAPETIGQAILVSHGMVRFWDIAMPVSMSARGMAMLRKKSSDSLLISDDLQMQGLQKKITTSHAVVQGVRVGMDMLIVGNNLMNEESELWGYAENLEKIVVADIDLQTYSKRALSRIAARKGLFQ